MSSLVQTFKQAYSALQVGFDPEIDNWFLMKSLGPLFGILGAYLLLVLKIGPAIMDNIKPFNLQRLIVAYNAYQVIFSTWMCSRAFKLETTIAAIFNNTCKSDNNTGREFATELWTIAWWYFFSKMIELLDTAFFVMRKKNNQVTFLHVFHHTSTPLYAWAYLKYLPGKQGIVAILLNSFVHIIMYFYYMLAAMGPKYQKYLWWKKYMTWIQLIQFCLMLTYIIAIVAMDCKLSRLLSYLFVANCFVFLYLFGNFYRTAYTKKNAEKLKNLLAEGDQMKQLIAQKDDASHMNGKIKDTKQE